MPTNNAQLIANFVLYLRVERAAPENTLANYEHDAREFAAWFEKPLALAQRTDMQKYISDSLNQGVGGRTAARRLATLRHFYRFLIDEEEISIDPTRNLPVPKTWKTVPKALCFADLETMVGSLGTSRLAIRDKAMLLTFFASGLRESELAALKLQDLDLQAGAAKVWNGKGGKDGLVPLNPAAISALKEYLETARLKLGDDGGDSQVFLGRRGKSLTRQQIYYIVRKIATTALGKHISPHSLRHGFATALVEGGADIRDVQVLMRHSSVYTTAIYVHTDLKYLKRIYYATHPRARIAKATD
jgi:integrase/recombinase XerD